MTSGQITAIVSAYAAVVSTLSLILAIKGYRAADPNVELHWIYTATDRKLVVSIHNTGRADTTIATVDLYLERRVIIRRSRISGYFDERRDRISHIPIELWLGGPKDFTFPVRLASHSILSFQVKNDSINLPSEYPIDELALKFVARFPGKVSGFDRSRVARATGGQTHAYLSGDVLRHFAGIDPDVPIRYPSPGSLPMED